MKEKVLFRHNGFIATKQTVTRAGYVVYDGYYHLPKSKKLQASIATNASGDYIGTPFTAAVLYGVYGIHPQLRSCNDVTCSIGYSSNRRRWFGWSHRAIRGFGIGSVCRKGDAHYLSKAEGGRGHWVAKTLPEARRMAIDFAEAVS